MNNVVLGSSSKYLASRLGIVNEIMKKAYISGKRIFVLVTDEFEFIYDLLQRESIIPIQRQTVQLVQNGKAAGAWYSGYNSIQYLDETPNLISFDAEKLTCAKPTVYLSTNGIIPEESLINYARHFNSMSSFTAIGKLRYIDTLRKSIILIVVGKQPDDSDSHEKGKKIPYVCDSLTEYIKIPYLSESEFNELLSEWLHNNENIPVSVTSLGYTEIADKKYLNIMFQGMRGLSPQQIHSCLESIKLNYGHVYFPDTEGDGFREVLKDIRHLTERVISKSGALSLKGSKDKEPNGMQNIIEWIDRNKDRIKNPQSFDQFQMRPSKGILLSGIPGSGKSMLASYLAHQLGISLVRLDLGDALGSYVGESEKGFKTALEVAETLSPCVLWIDEMEKMFEGGHEVTRRLIGKFLTWMQEKTDRGISCFVYSTANDISKMPPEMFRTGRFDEKFYTFMPCADDCASIFESTIRKQNKDYSELSKFKEQSRITPLFNTDIINKELFISILNKDCLKTKISANWDGPLPRDNKFFIGSDIDQLIETAKTLYVELYKDKKGGDAIYNSEDFIFCLRKAVNSIKTYGETNLNQIALAFSQIAKANFSPAAKTVIMPVERYDESSYKMAYNKNRNTDKQIYSLKDEEIHVCNDLKHEYDRQLYYVISRVLNSMSLDIIENRK